MSPPRFMSSHMSVPVAFQAIQARTEAHREFRAFVPRDRTKPSLHIARFALFPLSLLQPCKHSCMHALARPPVCSPDARPQTQQFARPPTRSLARSPCLPARALAGAWPAGPRPPAARLLACPLTPARRCSARLLVRKVSRTLASLLAHSPASLACPRARRRLARRAPPARSLGPPACPLTPLACKPACPLASSLRPPPPRCRVAPHPPL